MAPSTESRIQAREAANLMEQGKYRCRKCKQVFLLDQGILIFHGGAPLFAQCPECFRGAPIVMRAERNVEGQEVVFVGFQHAVDVPKSALIASGNMTDAVQLAAAQREKREIG